MKYERYFCRRHRKHHHHQRRRRLQSILKLHRHGCPEKENEKTGKCYIDKVQREVDDVDDGIEVVFDGRKRERENEGKWFSDSVVSKFCFEVSQHFQKIYFVAPFFSKEKNKSSDFRLRFSFSFSFPFLYTSVRTFVRLSIYIQSLSFLTRYR